MYYQSEITTAKNWVHWLSSFQVNEKRVADIEDRARLAISISNNFHKKKLARFVTIKENGELFIKRLS